MVVLTLSFQPLASALLDVKDVWWQEPSVFCYIIFLKIDVLMIILIIDVTTKNLRAIGLNQNPEFNDLTCK